MWTCFKYEKYFLKTISQWEFDYGLFINLPRIVKFTDFSPSIQTKKRYPTSLDKIRIFLFLSYQAKIFLLNLTPTELAPCKISHICRCTFNISTYRPLSGRSYVKLPRWIKKSKKGTNQHQKWRSKMFFMVPC